MINRLRFHFPKLEIEEWNDLLPKERAYEIARRAKEVWKNEERVREEIKRGKTLSQVLDLYMWEKK
jgi:3-hexulose-6-phosphate synthase/6-phospho-3-hexuloisomerase